MINIETLGSGTLKVHISETLDEGDFVKLGAEADQLIKLQGSINVLVDATDFEGWNSMAAARKHFTFVREHNKNVARIALVAGHRWQHWIAGIASVFVHPEIKVFDKGEIVAAEDWLFKRKQAA